MVLNIFIYCLTALGDREFCRFLALWKNKFLIMFVLHWSWSSISSGLVALNSSKQRANLLRFSIYQLLYARNQLSTLLSKEIYYSLNMETTTVPSTSGMPHQYSVELHQNFPTSIIHFPRSNVTFQSFGISPGFKEFWYNLHILSLQPLPLWHNAMSYTQCSNLVYWMLSGKLKLLIHWLSIIPHTWYILKKL